MSESTNHVKFPGTYFDANSVIRMARAIGVLSWIVAAIYVADLSVAALTLFLQIQRGFVVYVGFTDFAQNILYILERPLHGLLYFSAMQAVSKGLLIFLDVEDNTRRAARK